MKKKDKILESCGKLRNLLFDGLTITNDRETVLNYISILSHLNEIQRINVREKDDI